MKDRYKEFTDLTLNQREKLATIASDWWANKISGDFKHDNGDYSTSSCVVNFLADLGKEKIDDEKKKMFKDKLKEKIMFHMEGKEYKFTARHIELSCDYGPGFILKDAGEECNIPTFNFPFKVYMSVNPNNILLCDGYGKKGIFLFATKDYYEREFEQAEERIIGLNEELNGERVTYYDSKEKIVAAIERCEKEKAELKEKIEKKQYDEF